MGKGVGKLVLWHTLLHGGRILVEFKNLRQGRAMYYAKQIVTKLPVPATIKCSTTQTSLKLIGSTGVHYSLKPFY
jgi:ribosomal protein L16/L10AE